MTSQTQMSGNKRNATNTPTCHWLGLQLAISLLVFVSTANASYLDHIPAHHQTSYHTLLRKMRAAEIQASNSRRSPPKSQGCGSSGQVCSETCEMVQKMCSKSCSGNGCSLNAKLQEAGRMSCVASCFNHNQKLFGIGSTTETTITSSITSPITSSNASPTARTDVGAKTVVQKESIRADDTNLTPAEKCEILGFPESQDCLVVYDQKQPFKVIDGLVEKLMQATKRTEVTKHTANEVQTSETAEFTSPSAPLLRKKRRLSYRFRRRRSPQLVTRSRATTQPTAPSRLEVCPTTLKMVQPVTAVHWISGANVFLYHGNRTNLYNQVFEVGACEPNAPHFNIRIPGRPIPECRVVQTKYLANFMLNRSQVTSEDYRNILCHPVEGMPYSICRDWVYLNAQCKLYI
uniref:uncharacterized protein LOC100179973 isoform X2 n=1 Tax=Ciona intestinalis TaxID=7719 RepID=UPI000EF50780|nr:uncharacterized protein LOC100179973 isoform X2 [Ciona intestinalis]|eukprot:XP_026693296.1 uncharacterized protein LOC100179973 isoform X2 [Ciona intestinalis]